MHDHHGHHEHHEHGDAAPSVTTKEEAVALLHYSLHHNEHHLAELGELAAVLEKEGMSAAAVKLRLAAEGYEKANALLAEAYELGARGEG